ncbi:MAG: DUF6175 family protein [Prevotella sp.]|nr:DUF6175 family protein [Prevotella sp.]
MKKIILTLIMFVGLLASANAQQTVTVQPKIMVVPFVKEGEDIRNVLENDVNKRIVLTKIKEAFDSRGFTTVDFLGRLKALSKANGLAMDNQSDLKTMIIQQSGADIYVDAEIDVVLSGSGNGVKVIMTAYDTSTGNSLANKVGDSGKFYTDDIGRLASKAVEGQADAFLNVMQTKFNDIVANGRSINVTIGFAQTSQYSMSSEVGANGFALSDEIEMWMSENAYKGNYHIQGTTEKQMIFDDVRIPLKDDNGNNYNINKFGLKFMMFARKMGLQIGRDISNNTLIITIK